MTEQQIEEKPKSRRGGRREGAGRKPTVEGGKQHKIQFRFDDKTYEILKAQEQMTSFVVDAIKEHSTNPKGIKWHKCTRHFETTSSSPDILILKPTKICLAFDVEKGEYYMKLEELRSLLKEDEGEAK